MKATQELYEMDQSLRSTEEVRMSSRPWNQRREPYVQLLSD